MTATTDFICFEKTKDWLYCCNYNINHSQRNCSSLTNPSYLFLWKSASSEKHLHSDLIFHDSSLFPLSFHLYFYSSLHFLSFASHIELSKFVLLICQCFDVGNFDCSGICFDSSFGFGVYLSSFHLHCSFFMNLCLSFEVLRIGSNEKGFEIY